MLHPVSYGMHLRVKDKVLNIWSVLYAITILSVASLVLPLMIAAALFADITGNGRVSIAEQLMMMMMMSLMNNLDDDVADEQSRCIIIGQQ